VRPLFVVQREIPRQTDVELLYTGVVPEVDVLVLDRTPQSLDEDVVEDPPAVEGALVISLSVTDLWKRFCEKFTKG
jgi:hypothetical protein